MFDLKTKQKPHHLIFVLLTAMVFVSGCSDAPQKVTQPDLSGSWYIQYNIPDSMHYRLNLFVDIEDGMLSDQSGAQQPKDNPNSRVTNGVIDGDSVSFRWTYQNHDKDDRPGPILWDHKFQGRYKRDEKGNGFFEGTLIGTEQNNACEYPIPNTPDSKREFPRGQCPRHSVTGTWQSRRDFPR